jgi:surface polysaccharide O-acyltransferase-like enzyme
MLGVLIIHASGAFEWKLLQSQNWLSQDGLAAVLSQLSRFCVPMFMILSGYGLGYSEQRRGLQRFGLDEFTTFWRRRASRVLVPYLTWSLLSLALMHRLFSAEGGIAWTEIGRSLLMGGADYHLYFIAFLLQAYLLWPLLRRFSWTGVIALMLVQLIFASPTHVFWPGRPSIPGWLVIHWAGYFALGAKLAQFNAPQKPRALPALLVFVAMALVVVWNYHWWSQRLSDPGWFNHFCRYAVIAFSLSAIWLWRSTDHIVDRVVKARGLGNHIGRLSAVTFTVYFIHPWILRWLEASPIGQFYVAQVLVLMVLAFGVSLLLDRWLVGGWAKFPRLALGLGPR